MSSPTPPPLFQFSLRWLLVVLTIVAVGLGLLSVLGNAIGGLFWFLLFVVAPAPLLIAAIFGRGDVQAFSIGVLVPWGVLTLEGFQHGIPLAKVAVACTSLLIEGVICGGVAVATRRWLKRQMLDRD